MFADHAAVVPRRHAHAFFVGVRARLARCAARAEALPAAFDAPESFLYHALREQGVPVSSAQWLAPLVVSVDGRMAKWCARYMKLGVAELHRFGSYTECARWFLAPHWRDGNLSAAGVPRCGGAVARASREGGGGGGGGGGGAGGEGRPCTVASGCCRRHPRMPSCVHARDAR